jgi:hypothetical protein
MRTLILTVVLLSLIPFSLFASSRSNSGGLAERVAELEAQVEELSAILQFVHVEQEEMDGMTGPHWIIEGANVHVRSGSGLTDDNCWSSLPDFPNCEGLTGLGNLIVGYSERRPTKGQGFPHEARTGSHNLVVGKFHSYSSYGGFVAGDSNKVSGANASVSGGTDSEASGWFSSVSGGHASLASGFVASVSGGQNREAPDDFNWAAGSLFEPN